MSKAIIFDFDGVIVLSEQQRFNALQQISRRYGLKISDSLFKNIVGRTTKDFFRHNFSDLDQDIFEKILADYQVEYKDKIVDHVIPIKFTNDFIRSYDGNKILAVASGSGTKVLDTMLKHLGLHDSFELIMGQEHVEKHKPDPAIYLLAADKLNLKPSECAVVEDTAAGAMAANRAGMRVYALLNGLNSVEDFEQVKIEAFISNKQELKQALSD